MRGPRCRLALCLRLCLAGSATAQSNPSEAALAAAEMLEQASVSLDRGRQRARPGTGPDPDDPGLRGRTGRHARRVAHGRDSASRRSCLPRNLRAREEDVAQLLGVLQTIETTAPPVLMLHPSGPLGAARTGMMLSEVTPGLNAKAEALARDLQEVQTLRADCRRTPPKP